MKIVTENVERREKISVEYETRALTLITDDDERVVGLEYARTGRSSTCARARG